LIAVGISAVEFVAVIEDDGPLVGSSGIGRPLEDHLGPVHAHVVVHPAVGDHLALCGVDFERGAEQLAFVAILLGSREQGADVLAEAAPLALVLGVVVGGGNTVVVFAHVLRCTTTRDKL